MIHRCRIGAGTIVEPDAIVCDWAHVREQPPGARADGIVIQRSRFEDNVQIAGCLGAVVGRINRR